MKKLIAKSARKFELGCKLLINSGIDFEVKVVKTTKPKLEYEFWVNMSEEEFLKLEEQFKLQIS